MNIQKYLDLFEYKKDEESTNPRFKEGFWSFKREAIREPQKSEYRKMSDLIHSSDLDKDSAYTFTVEALQAIDSLITNFNLPKNNIYRDTRPPEGTKLEDYLQEPEILEQFSEAPVYTSEIMEWSSKGLNWSLIDDVIREFDNDILNLKENRGIIWLIRFAYTRAWEEHYHKVLEAIQ